jgi:two-component system cell cycle response regulator DivK
MVAEYLEFRGFSVLQASNGAEAMALVRRRLPKVILMDLSMAVMDGWEATRRLKADPKTRGVIVVAVTAHALKWDEQKARDAGCDGFIAKPFDLSALADGIQRLVTHGRRALPDLSTVFHPAKRSKRPPVAP